MKLFISPHNDDETLFGAFTVIRERPLVLIVTDSKRQAAKGIHAVDRRNETLNALRILGAADVTFLGIPDAELDGDNFARAIGRFVSERGPFEHFYVPAFEEGGNVDHNVIANSMPAEFASITTKYLTYTTAGKSRSLLPVAFEDNWPLKKLMALACYRSQILEPSTRDHFLRDQYEYYIS